MPPQGSNFVDHIEKHNFLLDQRGIVTNTKMLTVNSEMLNPFAVGHIVNHPPPDVAANVKLVDFDLPYTFFPTYMGRYIPYINAQSTDTTGQDKTATRSSQTMRAVAMVSMQTMAHGDELFIDYIEENRTEIDYTPDWLLEPPHPNPYLEKKEMISTIPLPVRMLIYYDQGRKGRTFDEFEGRTQVEMPQLQQA